MEEEIKKFQPFRVNVNSAPMMVDQSIGLIHSVPTGAELLETMMVEARECLQKTTARIQKQ